MMLAKPAGTRILRKKGYYFEPKLDGYRALCIKKDGSLNFITRNRINITHKFPEFGFSGSINAATCVLDGEIVVYDRKGNPSFSFLQNKKYPAVYVAFDILENDGVRTEVLPLEKRKSILDDTVSRGPNLRTIFFTENGARLWKYIIDMNIEGVIAKKKDSVYVHTETDSWLKIKRKKTIDCVVAGYTRGKRDISSLALGLYRKNRLVFIGKVGTGFTEFSIRELKKRLKKSGKIIDVPDDVIQVVPDTVCEVRYLEVTPARRLRAPVFLRIRDDKFPTECVYGQLTERTKGPGRPYNRKEIMTDISRISLRKEPWKAE